MNQYYGQHTRGCACESCTARDFEDSLPTDRTEEQIQSRIEAAVRSEREACAQIALAEIEEHDFGRYDYENSICERIAEAIRARSATK